jgi:hypothetical protein
MEDTSEDTSMRFGHEFLSGNMEDLKNDFGSILIASFDTKAMLLFGLGY